MFAELLTIERSKIMRDLLESYEFKPYYWILRDDKAKHDTAIEILVQDIARILNHGGFAHGYYMGKRVVGLCVVKSDPLASEVLRAPAYRIAHIIALGKSETQLIIKQLLIQETLRTIPNSICLVARCPYADLTTINALEKCGFITSNTNLLFARELNDGDWMVTPEENYEIHIALPDEVDEFDTTILDIPEGTLGWDLKLPPRFLSKVHKDWLRIYASRNGFPDGKTALQPTSDSDHALLVAQEHGRPVAVLAERIRPETTKFLGFSVGSIDLITTAPEYRTNGVSTALIQKSLTSFSQAGVKIAQLIVNASEGIKVQQYQQMGFFAVGTWVTMVHCRQPGNQTERVNKMAELYCRGNA